MATNLRALLLLFAVGCSRSSVVRAITDGGCPADWGVTVPLRSLQVVADPDCWMACSFCFECPADGADLGACSPGARREAGREVDSCMRACGYDEQESL